MTACRCGFALDGTAGAARDDLRRTAARQGWMIALWVVVFALATTFTVVLARHDLKSSGQARSLVVGTFCCVMTLVRVVRAAAAWVSTRRLIAALPEFPSARAVRTERPRR